jgi:hypothetical protein
MNIKKIILTLTAFLSVIAMNTSAQQYAIVDTNQNQCFNNNTEIMNPSQGKAFYGQDAQYSGNQPNYSLSADGLTVVDHVTGLTWQKSPDKDGDDDIDSNDKMSFSEAQDYPEILNAEQYGGFTDWRLPSIKELYSLILFNGTDPSGMQGNNTSGLIPYMDTYYFDFAYGDTNAGERIIDSQYWSSNEYVTTTMNGDHTVFGVNFADGRIKGYGTSLHGREKTSFVICVRGNTDYGINQFVDNDDETITDHATALMWTKLDSSSGLNWKEALEYAEGLTTAGYDDWRLPNAKELQSILDYTRSPETDGTAAIDPIFHSTSIVNEAGETDFPYYWSNTTHITSNSMGGGACYISFGCAMGYMNTWLDVHGAGAQRSDPKSGDPSDYPTGHGPQGDAIRIYNYVRCVRDILPISNVSKWNLY